MKYCTLFEAVMLLPLLTRQSACMKLPKTGGSGIFSPLISHGGGTYADHAEAAVEDQTRIQCPQRMTRHERAQPRQHLHQPISMPRTNGNPPMTNPSPISLPLLPRGQAPHFLSKLQEEISPSGVENHLPPNRLHETRRWMKTWEGLAR